MEGTFVEAAIMGILNILAPLVITLGAPYIAKKIRDEHVRRAIADTADAALTLAVAKSNGKMLGNIAALLQVVVDGILTSPTSPSALRKNPAKAAAAAAAAIARAGITSVQSVQVNADGSVTPITMIPR